MTFGPGGQREQGAAIERAADQGIGADEPTHPCGGARAEAAPEGDAVHTVDGRAAEGTAGGLEGHPGSARDHVAGARVEAPRPLSVDGHRDAIGLLELDLVVEGQREGERVEAGAQVRGAGGDADPDAHGARIPAFRGPGQRASEHEHPRG